MPAYAREIDEDHSNEIVLENKKVVIEKVHVSGLKRTKSDYIIDDLKPVFKSETFLQAYEASIKCRNRLLSKGIFQKVEVLIDTTEAYPKSAFDGVQIVFKVKERSLLCGEAKTEMSNNEKPRWVVRILSPNVFGRGETLATSFSHSLNSSMVSKLYQPNDFTSSLSKPFHNGANLRVLLLKESQDCPWGTFKQTIRGMETSWDFPLLGNRHSLHWQGHWRELACSSGNAAFEVRKQMGHSLKSAISHSVVVDKTDNAILPQTGFHFKLTEELAGLGGDVKFVKETLETSLHKTLLDCVTFGVGLQGGIMLKYGNGSSLINDKFFIGGPLTLRGFEFNSVGNQSSGSYLGSTAFWLTGSHVYVPLPFYWSKFGRGSWLDNFRMHGFVNAGNAFDFDLKNSPAVNFEAAKSNVRLSYGLGLAYKFMNSARIELNFCVPIRAQPADKLCEGLQFGIGISSV